MTFETTLGTCAISWEGEVVTGFWLPEARVARDDLPPGEAPPCWVERILVRVHAHLRGEWQDFSDLPFDWGRVDDFQRRVYGGLLKVRAGVTATYGELARAVGLSTAASRAIGTAMGSNPWPLLVPCHRVTGAAGKLGGFSAAGGRPLKARLLHLEGASLVDA